VLINVMFSNTHPFGFNGRSPSNQNLVNSRRQQPIQDRIPLTLVLDKLTGRYIIPSGMEHLIKLPEMPLADQAGLTYAIIPTGQGYTKDNISLNGGANNLKLSRKVQNISIKEKRLPLQEANQNKVTILKLYQNKTWFPKPLKRRLEKGQFKNELQLMFPGNLSKATYIDFSNPDEIQLAKSFTSLMWSDKRKVKGPLPILSDNNQEGRFKSFKTYHNIPDGKMNPVEQFLYAYNTGRVDLQADPTYVRLARNLTTLEEELPIWNKMLNKLAPGLSLELSTIKPEPIPEISKPLKPTVVTYELSSKDLNLEKKIKDPRLFMPAVLRELLLKTIQLQKDNLKFLTGTVPLKARMSLFSTGDEQIKVKAQHVRSAGLVELVKQPFSKPIPTLWRKEFFGRQVNKIKSCGKHNKNVKLSTMFIRWLLYYDRTYSLSNPSLEQHGNGSVT